MPEGRGFADHGPPALFRTAAETGSCEEGASGAARPVPVPVAIQQNVPRITEKF